MRILLLLPFFLTLSNFSFCQTQTINVDPNYDVLANCKLTKEKYESFQNDLKSNNPFYEELKSKMLVNDSAALLVNQILNTPYDQISSISNVTEEEIRIVVCSYEISKDLMEKFQNLHLQFEDIRTDSLNHAIEDIGDNLEELSDELQDAIDEAIEENSND